MRVLITGAKGLIGQNIEPILRRSFDVIGLSKEEWNILDKNRGEELIKRLRPEVIINLAAYTDVEGCEKERELAEKVNIFGAANIAELCNKHNIYLIHFSTDYVFDGEKNLPYTEKDLPNPLSFYGLTKLKGEEEIIKRHKESLIIRTQWIFGKGGRDFVKKLLEISKKKDEIEVVSDQIGSPTYAKDIGLPLKILIEKGIKGICHIANDGTASWFEFAKEIFNILKIPCTLKPITSKESGRIAQRPKYSVLSTERLKALTGERMRHWKEALREYLEECF